MTRNNNAALQAELLEVQRTLGWMDLVIGSITDAVYVVDEDSRLIFVNQYFSTLVGLPRVFLLGRTLGEVFHAKLKNDRSNQFLPSAETLVDKDDNTGIYEWQGDGRMKIFKISSRFIATIKQTVYIAKDITVEYEQSVIKSNFINIASHQLRTPMTSIMTYSHMLNQGYGGELNGNQKMLTESIIVSSEQMVSLINNILLISRLQNGDDNVRDSDGTLLDVFNTLQVELGPRFREKHLDFEAVYSDRVKKVRCNKFLVHEILSNLLTNGLQYTLEGKITMKAVAKGNQVKFFVHDTGIGIPQEYIPRIFNQFTRADNAFKVFNEGTGLGLYVIKIITDLMNGKIDCSSELGKGTTFTVTIPIPA